MSFANVSQTPNCQRDDQFDKFNSRVWYFLTEDLLPKPDGSLHEITITYNNNFSYNKMPQPIPIANRRVADIKDGFWPGTQLKSLHEDANSEDVTICNDSDNSIEPSNSDDDEDEVIEITPLTKEQEIENKQRACLQVVKSRIKRLLEELKLFTLEAIKLCYKNGLLGLETHLKKLVTVAKKKLSTAPLEL